MDYDKENVTILEELRYCSTTRPLSEWESPFLLKTAILVLYTQQIIQIYLHHIDSDSDSINHMIWLATAMPYKLLEIIVLHCVYVYCLQVTEDETDW